MSNPNIQQNTFLFTFASTFDTLAYSVQVIGDIFKNNEAWLDFIQVIIPSCTQLIATKKT